VPAAPPVHRVPGMAPGCVLSEQRRACFRPGTASGLRGFREKEEGARLAFRHPPSWPCPVRERADGCTSPSRGIPTPDPEAASGCAVSAQRKGAVPRRVVAARFQFLGGRVREDL
jgi:hypothetical protein